MNETEKVETEKVEPKSIKKRKPKVNIQTEDKNYLDGKFIIIRVGNDNYPAIEEDGKVIIEIIKKDFIKTLKDNNIDATVFATNHFVDFQIIG